MTTSIIAPSSKGRRATEIGIGVLFGIWLIGIICGTCFYVRQRRSRARLERDAVDMERGIRDGSVTTVEVIWEADPHPETAKEAGVKDGGHDGSIAPRSHHRNAGLRAESDGSAEIPTFAKVLNSSLDSKTQLSKPESAHLQN